MLHESIIHTRKEVTIKESQSFRLRMVKHEVVSPACSCCRCRLFRSCRCCLCRGRLKWRCMLPCKNWSTIVSASAFLEFSHSPSLFFLFFFAFLNCDFTSEPAGVFCISSLKAGLIALGILPFITPAAQSHTLHCQVDLR